MGWDGGGLKVRSRDRQKYLGGWVGGLDCNYIYYLDVTI